MTKYVAGIDPGRTGAMAVLNSDMKIIDICDWFSADHVHDFIEGLRGLCDIDMIILEKVHSMPKQGVKSVWTFAENFGMWQGLITAHGLPYQIVPPKQWMAGQITPSDHKDVKKRALTVCRRLYPDSKWFKLEKHHGRADAVLMARYAILNNLV